MSTVFVATTPGIEMNSAVTVLPATVTVPPTTGDTVPCFTAVTVYDVAFVTVGNVILKSAAVVGVPATAAPGDASRLIAAVDIDARKVHLSPARNALIQEHWPPPHPPPRPT